MNANIHNTRHQAIRAPQSRHGGQTASRLRYKHLAFGVGLALGSLLVCGTAAAASGVAATQSPTGGRVIGGAGSIVQHGTSTIINQQSQLLALDWQSFNVGKDASVLFKQPGVSAIALNRILDQNPSQIFGKISSNGQIFLINTHGIIFGASAQLNVGGLVASTLDLTPDDFLKKHFDLDAHGGHAGVVNHGTIAAASGGSVSLIGGHVENDGVIVADYGHINLDGADKAVLDFDGNGLINVEITGALQKRLDADQNAVANKGTLQATSGTVVLQASAAKNLFTNLVNNSGVIKAGGISTAGGVVRLVGSGGDTITSGNIDVSGTQGGSVQVLSDANVGVTGGSIDASGSHDGGSIRVGGGWQGGEGLPTAQVSYVAPDATLDASATRQGGGGSVVVWGDNGNNFYGNILARGGALGGDGGQVETSAHDGLNAQGHVDASAPFGRAGTWLLDPYNVTISTGTDTNTGTSPNFTASGTGSVVNAGEIGSALTGGSDVAVFTGSSGTEAGNITVSAPITASGTGSLYLMAAGSIFVNSSITGAGTGKPLSAYLWANYSGPAPGTPPYAYASGACATCTVIIGDSANGSIATYGGNVDIRTGDAANAGGSVSIGSTTTGITGTIDTTDGTNPSGSVTVASTGIAETAGSGNYVHAGAATFDAGAGKINLGNTGNDFTGAVSLDNSGANNVTLDNGANSLQLGTSNVGSGTLTVSGTGITQSGAITQAAGAGAATFNAGAGVLTLDNTGNDFTGAVSLDNSGANNVTLDNGTNALQLGASSVGSGTLTVSGTGIAQSGAITQAAGAGAATFNAGAGVLTLGNTGNDFTGAVSLNNSGANAATLDNGGNALALGDSTLGSGALNVLDFGTSALALDGHLITNGGAVSLNGAVNMDAAGGTTIDTTNNGAAAAGANIDITGALNGAGAAPQGDTLAAGTGGAVSLGGAVGDTTALGGLTVTGKMFSAASTLNVQSYTGGGPGNLSITTTGGDIGQSGAWTVGGTSTFSVGAHAITLSNTGNDFTGAVSLNNSGANNVVLTNTTALKLGNVAVGSGTLKLTGGGISQDTGTAITQAATAGTATFDAGAGVLNLSNSGNAFTGAVSLNNSGTNNVTLDDGSSALQLATSSVGSGTLTVSGTGITQSGAITQAAGAGAATFNAGAGVLMLGNTGNDFTGAVSLNNSGANAATLDNGGNALVLGDSTLGSGALDVLDFGTSALALNGNIMTSGGAVTLNGAVKTGAIGGTTIDTTDNGAVAAGAGIDITGAVNGSAAAAPNGIDTLSLQAGTGGAVTLGGVVGGSNALGGLTVTGNSFSAASTLNVQSNTSGGQGNLSITTTGGGISQNGAWTVGGTSTLSAGTYAITLGNTGNAFTGAVTLSNSGANAVALDNGSNVLTLGNVTVGNGTLSLSGTGITQAASTSITQATGAGAVTLEARGGPIDLGNTGNGFTGAVSLNNSGANNVTLNNGGNALQLSTSSVGSGTLTVSGTGITQSGAITQAVGAGAATFDAGAGVLTLGNSGNDFTGAVSLNNSGANNVTLDNGAHALQLGTSNLGSGTLTVSGTGITQSGAITQAAGAGAATFNAGAGALTLGNTGNDFTGAVSLDNSGANNVTLDNGTNALQLAASSVGSGTLTVSGTGITQSGAITQAAGAGAATFNAGAGVLALGNTGNDFTAAVSLDNSGADNVTLSNGINALQLGASSIGSGTLTVSGAGITQSGAIAQAANAGTATFNAGAGVLTLGNTGNDFTGAVSLNNTGANNVTLSNGSNALQLATSSVGSGTLAVSGTGITQSGAITQAAGAGAATFNAGAGVLTLGNTGNGFTGAVSLNNSGTNNVTLNNGTHALQLGTSSVGSGALTVSGTGITQSGAITQAAGAISAIFNAGAGVLTLDQANDFTGAVSLNNSGANNATLDNGSNPLQLGTSSVGSGTLTLTGGGIAQTTGTAITQAANAGATTFNAGSGALVLGNANNDITGAVAASGAGVTITTKGNLDVASLSDASTHDLSLIAGGTLAMPSGAIATGTGSITLESGSGAFSAPMLTGGNITLAANGGVLTTAALTGGDIALTGRDGINLNGSLTASGMLGLTSTNAPIMQSLGTITTTCATVCTTTVNAGTGPSAGAITLADIGNDFGGAVNLAGGTTGVDTTHPLTLGTLATGALTIQATGAVNLGTGTVGGTLQASSNGGAISEASGGLKVTGAATLNADTGKITLTDGNNDFSSVTATGAGVLITDTNNLQIAGLTDRNNGDVSLIAGGQLYGVGAITAGTGSITLTANGGPLNTAALTGGNIALTASGDITLGAGVTANGGTLTLKSGGSINQNAGAVITASSLTGKSTGATTLGEVNAIGTLDDFTANGFTLKSGQTLTVAPNSTVDGGVGGTALTATTGDLVINGTVGDAGGATSLTADAGAINENTGGIVAATTLTGLSNGDTTLAGANQIDTLGQFKADNLTLVNHKALAVTGPLVTTGNISLTTIGPGNVLSVGQALTGGVITLNSAGDLGVTNAIQGATVNLTANGNLAIDAAVNSGTGVVTLTQNGSAGQISQGSGSIITAGTLTGTAQGGVALEQANAVTNLGDFTAANGFSLNNGQALTVTAGHTVNGGTSTQLAASNVTIDGSVQGSAVDLNSSNNLVEGSNGTVTASVLTGTVAHSAQLTGANAIAGLGDFTANGLTLNDTGALAIASGATVDGGTSTTLTIGGGATGNLAIKGTLKGTATTLQVAGNISEAADGTLSAGTLTGSSGGSTLLTGNNDVASLGDFTANGFALTTDPGLTVLGGKTVDGRSSVALTTTGSGNDINIDGTVTGISVTLASSGAINEGADGMLQAGTLTGSSIGDAKLGQVEVGTLDAFKANSLDLADAQALTVAGPLTATGDISLATTGSGHALTINQALNGASIKLASADALTIAGTVTGTSVALASNGNMAIDAAVDSGTGTTTLTQTGSGAITAGANGAITAATLTGNATGATMLGSATQFVANQVGVLGGFSSPAGFSLTNGGTLTLASVGGSAYTVDAGKSSLYLAVKNGDLLQDGTNWTYDGTGTWSASGHIGLATAPIYVTGVDDQSVAFIGLPPAYFYAVDYQGNLLPLTGASSVNVPTSVLSSRSQGINGHTDHYIDFSVITANYRAYGVVPPGLLLPPDQWDCAPDQPSPEMCPRGN